MAKIDLNKMDLDELKTLHKEVGKAIEQFHAKKRKEALEAAKRAAKEKGFSLDELVGGTKPRSKSKPAVAKYRHPENPELTWSGRGRRPQWIAEGLEAGKSLEDYAIK